MTFIHELDIPVFTLFAFILLTVLLPVFLLLSEEAPNFKSGVSPGLPRCESLTNALRTFPFSLSGCIIHYHHMTGVFLDPSPNSQIPSKHFTNTLRTNIALFVSKNDFQFHEYHITISNFRSLGLMEASILHL